MYSELALKCIVVDDDLVDRLTTISFLQKYSHITILGNYASPIEALAASKKNSPDIIFLDVDMSEMSGLELRKQLLQIPACVFITNYPEYAIDGFNLEAFDFLVKPFSPDRFEKMIARLNSYFEIRNKASILTHAFGSDSIFIKEGTKQIQLKLHEVYYLEAMKDYTGIITSNKKYLVLESLGNLMKEKTFTNFIRIHRSYAVHKFFIQGYNSYELLLNNNITLPIGRSFKDLLKGSL